MDEAVPDNIDVILGIDVTDNPFDTSIPDIVRLEIDL
jgi:hypothetical protein